MTTSLKKKNKGGRPTKMTDEVVQKLEDIFQRGGTVEEATSYARIARRSYHYWMEQDEVFAQKMESAQHYADIVAKKVVVDTIVKDKNDTNAKWWLEKREFKASNKTNIQVNIPTFNVMSEEAKIQLEKLYEGSDSTND